MSAATHVLVQPDLADERPIDLVHLARITLGERSLEREVLQLFQRQAAMLLARMRSVGRPSAAALAHTLKGSARGIGAWRAARAAEALEAAIAQSDEAFDAAHRALTEAVDEACGFIAEILRADSPR